MRITNRKICLLLDIATIALVLGLTYYAMRRSPQTHYDVDRAIYPVKGIDISAHNGTIDYAKAKTDTVSFVIIKATEGTDFCDANFSVNYTSATQAGMKVGAYHFFRFDTPGDIQALHFINTIADKTFDIPLVVDVERWGNTTSYDVDDAKIRLHRLVSTIQEAGYPLMIYTNKHDYNTFVKGDFDNIPLWVCSLSATPPKTEWKYWQHSHAGKVKGANGNVDLNTYNGMTDDFEKSSVRYTVTAQ